MDWGHRERKVNNRKAEGEVLSGNLVEWIYQWNSSITRGTTRQGCPLFTGFGWASETERSEIGHTGGGFLLLDVGPDDVA